MKKMRKQTLNLWYMSSTILDTLVHFILFDTLELLSLSCIFYFGDEILRI